LRPDCAFVYAGGAGALAIFERDPTVGTLRYVGVDALGPGLITGAAFSADGVDLYVAVDRGLLSAEAVVHARVDIQTGRLVVISTIDGMSVGLGVAGAPNSVALSPDGRHLYVTTIYITTIVGQPQLIAGAIAVFSLDPANGELAYVSSTGDAMMPFNLGVLGISVSPNGDWLDAINFPFGEIGTFQRDAVTGLLRYVGSAELPAMGLPSSLIVSPDGSHVYASTDGGVAQYIRSSDGTLRLDGIHTEGLMNAPAGALGSDANGAFLFLVGPRYLAAMLTMGGCDGICVVGVREQQLVTGLSQTANMALSGDGHQLYVASGAEPTAGGVSVFSIDPVSGWASFTEAHLTGPVGQVVESPDGGFVYASGGSTGASILGYARHPGDGTLDAPFTVSTTADIVGDLVFARDGKHGYLAQTKSAAASIATVVVDPNTGGLAFGSTIKPINPFSGNPWQFAHALQMSPDGGRLYAIVSFGSGTTSQVRDGIVVFSRNSATGSLVVEQLLLNGAGGVSHITGAFSLAVGIRDLDLYVAALNENAVVGFHRATETDPLHQFAAGIDGKNGIDGLSGIVSVVVGGPSNLIYAAGSTANAVAVLKHRPDSLRLLDVYREDPGKSSSLRTPTAMTFGLNQRFLYIASAGDSALRVFEVEPSGPPLCTGDCNGDGVVSIDELVTSVQIALGQEELQACPAVDSDDDGRASIADLITSVRAALDDCAS